MSIPELIPALRDAGFDDHVIAGIVANADHESSGDPTAIGDDGTSIGLWQWHGPRDRLPRLCRGEQSGPIRRPDPGRVSAAGA